MIEITIPKFDLSVKFNEINEIPKGLSGVYILYDDKEKPLYVGIAKDLASRLEMHFLGISNTSRYRGKFYKASMFFEPNELNRRIYELYLIETLECEGNIAEKKFVMDPKLSDSIRCNFIKDNNEQCKHKAHTNGYCRFHGGNGISRGKLIQEAIKTAVSTYESSLKAK